MPSQVSPITGQLVEVVRDGQRDITYYNDVCGRWGVTLEGQWSGSGITEDRLHLHSGLLSELDTRKTLALARSEVWSLSYREKTALFMLYHDSRQDLTGLPPNHSVLTLDDIYESTKTLNLDYKAARTLQNLAIAEGEVGAGVDIPYDVSNYPGDAMTGEGGAFFEDGMSYGCLPNEALLVYHMLSDSGLVEVVGPQHFGAQSRAYVTPLGYSRIGELAAGRSPASDSCFFVCLGFNWSTQRFRKGPLLECGSSVSFSAAGLG